MGVRKRLPKRQRQKTLLIKSRGIAGLLVPRKYSKTTGNCSHSYRKTQKTAKHRVVLLVLHPKLILQESKHRITVPLGPPSELYYRLIIVIILEMIVLLIYRQLNDIFCIRL